MEARLGPPASRPLPAPGRASLAPSSRLSLFALPALLATGCAKHAPPAAPPMVPSSNVYLRSSFDTDPSAFLGRFLPAETADLDESNGMSLACSEHVSWSFIDGGDVRVSEVVHASTAVHGRLGAPLARGQVEGATTRAARVSYTLTGKLIGQIDDPAAFDECCKSQPDQCTDRMVGEFLQGTGSVYFESSTGSSVQAEALLPGPLVGGEVVVSHGVTWERAVEFPKPVYFAFKVTPTPYTHHAVTTCEDWVDTPPSHADGLHVVGHSGPVRSEQVARRKARADALAQAGAATGLETEAKTKGTTLAVQEADWCVEPVQTGSAVLYTAHLLGFVSQDEQDRIRNLPAPLPPPAVATVARPCASWVDAPPSSDGGLHVVGSSRAALTEPAARRQARTHAVLQAGRITGLAAHALASGAVIGVQERDWCVEKLQTGAQTRYRAHVLGFVSDAEQARVASLPTLAEQLAAPQPAPQAP